jgi:glyoxylase-like metal-dependent hydrolase (beta-lactamase superfamily II)
MTMLARHLRWFDDWFAIEDIAPGVFAIGEPHYHQINWTYLICGKKHALLFDTGPGLRDIRPVVESLTDRFVIALASHLHYDHTGNLHRFNEIALADVAGIRGYERDGMFYAPRDLYLGHLEDMEWMPIAVAHWWPVGEIIDLGERALEIIGTPGHSPDSISLYDREQNIFFAADFLYPGELYAQTPGASLADYLATADRLLGRLPSDVLILCAHGMPDGDNLHAAPKLARLDLEDLQTTLAAIKAGAIEPESAAPDRYTVNDHLALLAGSEAYDWPDNGAALQIT